MHLLVKRLFLPDSVKTLYPIIEAASIVSAIHRKDTATNSRSSYPTFREDSYSFFTSGLTAAFRYPLISSASTVVRERFAVFSISG